MAYLQEYRLASRRKYHRRVLARKLLQPYLTAGAGKLNLPAMITLTPRAAAQVRNLRAGVDAPEKLLRLFVENGGCSGMQYGMSFDGRKEGDNTFESEGVEFLVDKASLEHLEGVSIDFDDGLHGKGFEIRNPNAHTTCGCGKSFN